MSQQIDEATRVMAPGGSDRTLVAGSFGAPPPPSPNATQMGVTVTCAVCKTTNPGLESYCVECGFVLASSPGEAAAEAAPAGPVWELVESGSGRRFPLKEGATTIGRENGDILLLDGTISRRHARIEMSGGTITVVDEGSTNGSQVDGIRLAPNQGVKAAPGAAIRFGSVTLTLVAPDAAAPAPLGSSDVTIAVEVGAAPMAVAEPAAEESVVPTGAAVDPSEPPSAHLKPTTENAEPILIRTGRTTLGRRAGNDVILAGDPFISGSHAEITCDYNGCYLTDVGSTNGTVVNGQKLEAGMPQLLLDGDTVVLGQATYTFATLEQPEEDEEEADEATAEAEPAVEANDIPVATGEEDSAEAPKA